MPRIPASFANILIDRVLRQEQPGADDAIFPRVLEEAGIFTFSGRPAGLEWRLEQMIAASFTAAVGVTNIADSVVAATGLRYYHAISASHNDTVARNMTIEIRSDVTGAIVGILTQNAVAQGELVVMNRPIVIGERHQIRATVNAIQAGFAITLRTYSASRGLGSELPGL